MLHDGDGHPSFTRFPMAKTFISGGCLHDRVLSITLEGAGFARNFVGARLFSMAERQGCHPGVIEAMAGSSQTIVGSPAAPVPAG
ncbi:hypothetical protein EMIT0P228_40015 [Pseudomonas brassicacearum]